MAFQDLVNGDCSGTNAMSKFTSHLNQDHSIQREFRQNQAGPSRQIPTDDRFAQEFFNERQAHEPHLHLDELGHELDNIRLNELRQQHHAHHHPPTHGGWADEFQQMGAHPPPQQLDAEFERIYQQEQRHREAHGHPQHGAWEQEFLKNPAQYEQVLRDEDLRQYESLYQSVSTAKLEPQEWAEEFHHGEQEKGKEKAAWADEFQELDPDADAAAFKDMNEVWRQMGEQHLDEFDEEEEIWNSSNMVNPFGQTTVTDKPYQFELDNPYLSHPAPFEEGLQLMEKGNLSDASLAFEAEVQKNPKNARAWYRLGIVQQENEKEYPAISALREAVSLEPENMDASLALAVSYTNEGAENQALDALENWICTRYAGENFPAFQNDGSRLRHDYVADLYLQAVRNFQGIDPDVQVGLGVLFNISSEYDKAVDCFAAALQSRPEDYVLWNRLGATLANGGRSEEAIDAYYKALQYKPSYVRARYNLGVSCINIGCYKEAAEHFLGALSLHGDTNGRMNVSNNLWDTLRRTFLMMDRRDLFDKAQSNTLDVFHGEFEF